MHINEAQYRHYLTTAPHCMIIHKAQGRIIITYGDRPTNYIAPAFIGNTIEEALHKMKTFFNNGLKAADITYRAAALRFANNIKPLIIQQVTRGDTSNWEIL